MGYDLPATCPSAHTGDTPKRLCTAMCQPKQAAVHCTWCKCSSCAFCLPAPPPPPPLPPPPPVPPGECRSEKSDHGDSTKPGCSPWCKLKDCAVWCKCQACAVCVSPPSPPPSPLPPPPPPSPPELACHSGIHGDASVTQCAPWCSLDSVGKHGKQPLMEEHCEHCKCKVRCLVITPTVDRSAPVRLTRTLTLTLTTDPKPNPNQACRQCVTTPHFQFTLDQRGPYRGLCCFYPAGATGCDESYDNACQSFGAPLELQPEPEPVP